LDLSRRLADLLAADSAATDGSGALPDRCGSPCAEQTLSATFGGTSEPFERAVYGVETGADAGLYLEALHGGFSGCPSDSSPTPQRTLVVSGLTLPVDNRPINSAQGLAVTLLDFAGTLLPSRPVAGATSATAVFRAARLCADCVGQPAPADPDGFVALDLEASFDGGTVTGRIFATHCDSLDR
jgi:hypothetical protein